MLLEDLLIFIVYKSSSQLSFTVLFAWIEFFPIEICF